MVRGKWYAVCDMRYAVCDMRCIVCVCGMWYVVDGVISLRLSTKSTKT